MLFANSNIDTPEEFEKRKAEAEKLAKVEGVRFAALPYDHDEWLREVAAGYEDEPEKGRRCARCFRYNLAKAAAFAAAEGLEGFTTSLTVSPHKVSKVVFDAGRAAEADGNRKPSTAVEPDDGGRRPVFLAVDFKKREGFKLSVKRAAELGLYRQGYCGCEFSKMDVERRSICAGRDCPRPLKDVPRAMERNDGVKKILLASGSPRRAKILAELGVEFEVVKTDAPEVSYPHDPERTVRENALAKGAAAKGEQVLSADTIVWFANRIYGKPRDLAEAKEFLRELSGNVHTVFTGVAFDGEVKVVRSDVKFRTLSEAMIDDYVARVKPTDRAGAYDIDESGDLIVESHSGSYENIMGLPVEPLREWGVV